MTECAEWQPELGNELVREVLKSEEWKRLKLESLADDCKGLRDMILDMLRGDTHMVDVKKLVKYAWENTEGKGRPISATEEEWSRPPGTAQSLMGGNVAAHEGTTSQVRFWADRKGGRVYCDISIAYPIMLFRNYYSFFLQD